MHARQTAAFCLIGFMLASLARADESAFALDIPAQSLKGALSALAEQTGLQIVYQTDLATGLSSPAVKGKLTPSEALQRLLRGSGLGSRFLNERAIAISSSITRETSAAKTVTPTARLLRLAQASTSVQGYQVNTAPVPSPAPTTDVNVQEIVVVTGSHIRGTAPVGSVMVTLDRTAIVESGAATAEQLLRTLPQVVGLGAVEAHANANSASGGNDNQNAGAGVNLRGLGNGSTLVLLNGRRLAPGGAGTFVDLSSIPLSAVGRVEVLADGASATYGSDAVAGVVNIILRSDFRGAETSLRLGSADGGAEERQFSQLFGFGWSTGSLLGAYEYYDRDRLGTDERAYFTDDLRPFGGRDLRETFSNPGTISAAGQTYAIPAGQDGTALTSGDLVAGTANRVDRYAGTDILPHQNRHSVLLGLRQSLAPSVSLVADALFTERRIDRNENPVTLNISVPASNPFFVSPVGAASAVTVAYSLLDDIGPRHREGRIRAMAGSIGAEIELPATWKMEGYGAYSRDDSVTLIDNLVNAPALASALADTNPATAMNPFGDGSNTPLATLNTIRGFTRNNWIYDVLSMGLKADGKVFRLPGGDVKLALGVEYREENYNFNRLAFTSTVTPLWAAPVHFDRNVGAVYSELFIPLFGPSNARLGLRRLDLSVAGRIEDYDAFGTTTNPKVGIAWSPTEGVLLRGAWGTSFRAPLLTDLDGIESVTLATRTDPTSPTGHALTLSRSGSNSMLNPEEATTWSAGVTLAFPRLPRIDLTYFDIKYEGRLARLSGEELRSALVNEQIWAPLITRSPSSAEVEALLASPNYFGGVVDPGDITAIIDGRLRNIGTTTLNGVDVAAKYEVATGVGKIELQGMASYIFRFEESVSSLAPMVERVSTLDRPVDLRARIGAVWELGAFGASAFLNYVDGYRNLNLDARRDIGSWTTVDAQVTYAPRLADKWIDGLSVSLVATNLANRDPPFVDGLAGYDAANANTLGRVVALQVRKIW